MGTEASQALTLICDYDKSKLYIVSVDLTDLVFQKDVLYWIGYIYRYWHYYSGEDSAKILRQAPVETMKRNFMIFHTMDPVLAIEDLKEIHNQKNYESVKISPTMTCIFR